MRSDRVHTFDLHFLPPRRSGLNSTRRSAAPSPEGEGVTHRHASRTRTATAAVIAHEAAEMTSAKNLEIWGELPEAQSPHRTPASAAKMAGRKSRVSRGYRSRMRTN